MQKRIDELTLENAELSKKLKFKNNEQDESLEYFKLLAEENERLAVGADEETKLMRRQHDRQLADLKSQLDQMRTSFEINTKHIRAENELLSKNEFQKNDFILTKKKY